MVSDITESVLHWCISIRGGKCIISKMRFWYFAGAHVCAHIWSERIDCICMQSAFQKRHATLQMATPYIWSRIIQHIWVWQKKTRGARKNRQLSERWKCTHCMLSFSLQDSTEKLLNKNAAKHCARWVARRDVTYAYVHVNGACRARVASICYVGNGINQPFAG